MRRNELKGAVLDLDGVITGTARVHALAWESMFNDYLKKVADREGKPFVPFDPDDDYLLYVDGKPRMQGVKSFLESRGIELPFGEMSDPPEAETVCGLGNRKNKDFQKVLKREGPDVFQSSVAWIKEARRRGLKVGVASSSRNCQLIIRLAGIEKLFDARIDGVVSAELGLTGKPDPDIFVVCAEKMGLRPGECVVVEDAISGVQAGRNGNFGLCLGIARSIDGGSLLQNGADLVVRDMAEMPLSAVQAWFREGIEQDGWHLTYRGFDPEGEKLRETLTAVGNGYMGVRGAFEGESAGQIHYPGTYLAGIYNKIPTPMHGRDIYNNDLVNCPNWLLIEYRVGKGPFESPLRQQLLSYVEDLDLRQAVLCRTIVCKDQLGRITRVQSRRLASMADPHLCAIRYCVTPLNYSDEITIRSSLDGTVINDGVARYRALRQDHLEPVDEGATKEGVFLHVKTNASDYQIHMAAKHRLLGDGKPLQARKKMVRHRGKVGEQLSFFAHENGRYTLEKLVAVYTSLDRGERNPARTAANACAGARSFQALRAAHARAWERLWDKADIEIDGDRFVQMVARLHAYHLLVTASPHVEQLDVGMPARGLHGEAYRGHVFWDELYILPFFNLHFPDITRALLRYRYRRLPGARQYAQENGYRGAMYPWQTCDGGDEETQEVHYNPKSDSWGPDLSRRQRHVSIAIFFNTWKYVQSTGDQAFLRECGAEIMLEIARFWASIARKSPKTGKYHIDGVMGPDEFHEKLPRSKKDGIKDNAYTNIMVVWCLERSLELLEQLPERDLARIASKIGFDEKETDKWRDITRKMNVKLTDQGVISQFEGYMGLKELDWKAYREKYGDIHRMDRILKAEGDSPDRYRVAKQADTLMTWYVLAPREVKRVMTQLGYKVRNPITFLKRNYEYYEGRTSHGSTLSKVVHALLSSYIYSGDTAWQWFLEAMESDINDTQGGTTLEGIHCGVMGGTLDLIYRYFGGLDLSGDVPAVSPHLPAHWKRLAFKFCHQGTWYQLEYTQQGVKAAALGKGNGKVPITVLGQEVLLAPGKAKTIKA